MSDLDIDEKELMENFGGFVHMNIGGQDNEHRLSSLCLAAILECKNMGEAIIYRENLSKLCMQMGKITMFENSRSQVNVTFQFLID